MSINVQDDYKLILLQSPGYESNISLRRIIDHRILGRNFARRAHEEPLPDVIHCAFPTIELAYEVARFASKRAIPFVLDARDMWPDIYLEAIPKFVRSVGRLLLNADFRMTRHAFARATAISGHAPGFVDWGVAKAGRDRSPFDRHFPFAYPTQTPDADELAAADAFWRKNFLALSPDEFVICFFGTFAERREVDLTTVLDAARKLRDRAPQVKIVLCGTGPALSDYAEIARDLPNVVMPGWVDAPKIWFLMRHASVGLLPYLPSKDFLPSMPNKSIEYLSASLPILTCLSGGHLEEVLGNSSCAVFYEAENPESLVRAVLEMVADEAKLAVRRESAARLFKNKFQAEKVCGEMVDHLELLASQSGSRTPV